MAAVLDAPTLFELTPGDGSVALNFTLPGDTSFTDVLYSTSDGAFLSLGATGGVVTITKESDGVTDLVNDTAYSIVLVGVSDEYPLVPDTLRTPGYAFTPVATAGNPSPPIILSTTPVDQSIILNYVLGDNGGSAVTAVYYTTDGGVTFDELTGAIDGNATITTLSDGVTPIENDTQVVIQIVAVNAVEPLPADNLVSTTILATPALVTTPADSPNILGYTPGDATLNVTYSLGSNGGGDFISVYYSTDNGATWKDSGATTGVAQILNMSDETGALINGQTYQVRLLVTTDQFPDVDPEINLPSRMVGMQPHALPVAPGPPSLDTFTSGNQSLSIYYTPRSDGGSSLTNVYYSTDNGVTWYPTNSIGGYAVITTESDGSTPLLNGTTYYVLVVNVTGSFTDPTTNPRSNTISMQPSSGSSPPAAVQIASVSPGDKQLEVSYTLNDTGGSDLIGIYYSTDGISWKNSESISGNFFIKTQSNGYDLENGTPYFIQLTAATIDFPTYLDNPISSFSTQVTPLGFGIYTSPSAPEVRILPGNATFTLEYTVSSDGGSPLTDVLYSTNGGTSWYTTGEMSPFGRAVITTESDGSTPLSNSTLYSVQVVALTAEAGTTNNFRSYLQNITLSATAISPGAPLIVASSAGNSAFQIDYNLVPGSTTIYDVQYTTNGGMDWLRIGNSSPAILTTDSQGNPLVNGTFYVIYLVAIAVDFSDPNTNSQSVPVVLALTTDPLVPPDAPEINGSTPGNEQLEVFFNLGSVGSGTLWSIWYTTNTGNTPIWVNTGVNKSSFIMKTDSDGDMLVNGQEYNVRIVATTSDSQNPVKNTPSLGVLMTPIGAPVAPTPPTITSISPGNTTLGVTYRLESNGGSYYTYIWYSTDGSTWQELDVGSNINNSSFGTISYLSSDGTTPLTNGVTYPVQLTATTDSFSSVPNDISTSFSGKPSLTSIRPSAPIINSWFGLDGALVVYYNIPSDGGSDITAVYYSTDSGLSWDPTPSPNGTAVITMTSGGSGPIVDSTTYGVRLLAVTVDFPFLSNPSSPTVYMVARPTISGTFKPKGMTYTEFLRSKKADRVKILNTKPVRTASEITNARRLGASTVFALNNEAVKGSITTAIDFSQGGLHAAQSYYKQGGGSRRVGSASEFTAFSGSQAIGGLVQAGLPPTRLLQQTNFILVSPPVTQGVSDYLRREQGVRVSLGQKHNLTTVTPPVFVDNTIRNTGSPATVTRPAIHDIKAKNAFAYVPNRPSQAEGQYALKGDAEPGKELGAVGGNPHYKAGAALKNIPYVEKHRGNDWGVNPKRPFVKFQIPAGATPVHLKANKPVNTI